MADIINEKSNKFKTPTGRRKKSLLDAIYGKEFVDELRKEMNIKERQKLKEQLKEVIKKCNTLSWGLTVDDFYELLIDNGVTLEHPTEKEFEEMRELAEQEGRTMSNLLRYLVAKERELTNEIERIRRLESKTTISEREKEAFRYFVAKERKEREK